jgi:hypothetical protein
MHQLKDILDSTTTEQIIHDHQQFLLKNQESQLVSSLSSFLQKERSSARE